MCYVSKKKKEKKTAILLARTCKKKPFANISILIVIKKVDVSLSTDNNKLSDKK